CTQPLLMSTSYEKSPPGRAGEVTGMRLTANNLARVVMPLLSGAIGTALGAAPGFWMNAVNLASISLLARRCNHGTRRSVHGLSASFDRGVGAMNMDRTAVPAATRELASWVSGLKY